MGCIPYWAKPYVLSAVLASALRRGGGDFARRRGRAVSSVWRPVSPRALHSPAARRSAGPGCRNRPVAAPNIGLCPPPDFPKLAASTDSARITRFNNENEAQADALNFGQSSGWKLASSDEHSVLWQSLDSRL
uniref:Uncharacterized protein n=1 Tax=Zea mays TaxID=4577 RepID=A0A804UHT2_MAIZE